MARGREDRGGSPAGNGAAPSWRRRLSVAAIAGGAVVVLALTAYLFLRSPPTSRVTPPVSHVGSDRCRVCHAPEIDAWKGSHHAAAMAAASDATVLGDFRDAQLDHRGKAWRFFRDGQKFVVHAEGPDGQMHDYEVRNTFGVEPLQQYLIVFPGGRLQTLSAAWDTRAHRWFHVNPGPDPPPGDWLHWTRPGQNWNAMCADCHSTNVQKRYDPDADSYQTTWSEISVGCEACHGPASRHVAWAEQPPARRPAVENAGLVTRTAKLASPELGALCAPCHSRRAQFADQGRPGGELLDRYLPTLLAQGVFHPDGQILDEDFEWQAFTQSKMYARGVRCTDCHDPHSGKLRREGNALCTGCHRADAYDDRSHHFHAAEWQGKPSAGVLCVSCHMPGRNYMRVHFRRDHSLRVPRPDLTASISVPNACSSCHADRPLRWIQAKYDEWYGKKRKSQYGTALAAGQKANPQAEPALVRLAGDLLEPVVARATAVDLLGRYTGPRSLAALREALTDPEPLMRVTAAQRLPGEPAELAARLGPLLEDPVRAVRAQAAARLAGPASMQLAGPLRHAYTAALEEYVQSQRYTSDLPSGPYNLGNLEVVLGKPADAERHYRRAIGLDEQLFAAKANLAMLLAGQGKLDEAEPLLRQARTARPDDAGLAFNLGLLLAERGKRDDAEQMLRAALKADPRLAAAAYNLAVMVGEARPREAVALARQAARAEPGVARYAWTFGYYQARSGDLVGAAETLEPLLRDHPDYGDTYGLLAEVYARQGRTTEAGALLRRRPRP